LHSSTKTVPARVIGLDIGGANLKAAHTDKTAITQPFLLWKQPQALTQAIQSLVAQLPDAEHIAATMTGELCDCFSCKTEGVRHILGALKSALPSQSVWLWRNDARLVTLEGVGEAFLPLAAANWLALACFAGRLAPLGAAILIDMGSTTTDIIPLVDGRPQPTGRTDLERIRSGELVYLGASRTPLCALLGPPFAAEWFATTQDAYLVLGPGKEDPSDRETADGRPATRRNALARIARMVCADAADLSDSALHELAADADRTLRRFVRAGLEKTIHTLSRPPECLIISGSGEFLLERIVAECFDPLPRLESFRANFGPALSSCACAYALAKLTQEYLSHERTT
jgi:probable H4MPT-linked C1 transfer pathway protein